MKRIGEILQNKLLKELKKTIASIESGHSTLNEDDLIKITTMVATFNVGNTPRSKNYICTKILHCSTKTFDNYIKEGLLPQGRKRLGFNELSWLESDFLNINIKSIRENKRNGM